MTFLYILAIIVAFAAGLWVGTRDDGEELDEFDEDLDCDWEKFDEF